MPRLAGLSDLGASMSVTAILAVLRGGASLLFEFAKTWIGGFTIAFVVAWLWSGHRHDAACAAREKAAEAERVRIGLLEHSRREDAIAKARRDADAAAVALTIEEAKNADLKKDIENASKANDRVPCIDGAGVMRLDRIGRKKAR
jgi:hypothetical protein